VAGTDAVVEFFKTQRVALLPPRQYMDKFTLTVNGVTPTANDEIKAVLGFTKPLPTASGITREKIAAHSD
jgi:hypothetical protein